MALRGMLGRREGLVVLVASFLLIAAAFEASRPPPSARSLPVQPTGPSASSSLAMPSCRAAGPERWACKDSKTLVWSDSFLSRGPAAGGVGSSAQLLPLLVAEVAGQREAAQFFSLSRWLAEGRGWPWVGQGSLAALEPCRVSRVSHVAEPLMATGSDSAPLSSHLREA